MLFHLVRFACLALLLFTYMALMLLMSKPNSDPPITAMAVIMYKLVIIAECVHCDYCRQLHEKSRW